MVYRYQKKTGMFYGFVSAVSPLSSPWPRSEAWPPRRSADLPPCSRGPGVQRPPPDSVSARPRPWKNFGWIVWGKIPWVFWMELWTMYRIYMWFIWDFYDLYGMSMITWDFTKKLELKLNLLYIFVWFHWNRGRGIKIEFLWGLTKIWDDVKEPPCGWWNGMLYGTGFTSPTMMNPIPRSMVDARDETRLEG